MLLLFFSGSAPVAPSESTTGIAGIQVAVIMTVVS